MPSTSALIGSSFLPLIEPLVRSSLALFILIGCSVVAVAVFIERLIHLRSAERDTASLVVQLRPHLREGNLVEAIGVCEQMGGTVAAIVQAGLQRHGRNRDEIEGAMEVSGMVEIASLERNAKILSLIAQLAPLIGLLGTVLGFIQAFAEMRLTGLMDISTSRLGEAMEYALITTAAGLVLAIPATVAYNYLVSRIEGLVLDAQTASSEICELLFSNPYATA